MARRRARDGMEAAAAAAKLAARLADGPPLVLDGALGTEIERHGGNAGLPLWSARALLEDPGMVARIHQAYASAGAEVLVANTFRTQARTLAHAGAASRAAELTTLAVRIAREAAASARHPCWVAGSAPTLEDCYHPDRVPADDALASEHAAHVANLVAAGVDLVLIETINTVREAFAALEAARNAGAGAIVSFVCNREARLLSGEPLEQALAAVTPLEPLAVGVNCLPPSAVDACLPALAAAGIPFLAYANLGAPTEDGGFRRTDALSPEEFAEHAEGWVAAGARGVGGCCGTTPDHVAAIANLVSNPGGS